MRLFLALLVLAFGASSSIAQEPASSVEAQLCRSQLELLLSGGKLTAEEEARFEAQCACLEEIDAPNPEQCPIAENV